MDETQLPKLAAWVTDAGLAGASENMLLAGFSERAIEAGLPLARASVLIDTLHPIHEGRVFGWERDKDEIAPRDYARSDGGENDGRWRRSPFYRLLQTGDSVLRRRLTAENEAEFSIFPELRVAGMTDYMAIINRFAADGVIGHMDCVYSSWVTDAPGGFCDADLLGLQYSIPFLALAVKSASLGRIAENLVETYLGRDAGHRVLKGGITRGVADRIDAVLWFSDLRGFTRITDTSPEHVIPMLDDYFDAIVGAIHDRGGDVLKLIGDGVLAIFTAHDRSLACKTALAAAKLAQQRVAVTNERRFAEGVPTTDAYLGLHVGEVFYGNVGSKSRLDFTVIGPAVNEVSRIAAMCRSAEQPLLLSSSFVDALKDRKRFVSVGRYALRGVGRPQELFTVDPEA
ncbi:MAG: adenylate/guanylate cyclase domain-containing protein [Proteobacteria bacterium]|nr:MAG: adenylate/guanylate cyclase domain-containing protein [Pseudomonadota bacterium]